MSDLPLILLHGWGGRPKDWQPLQKKLVQSGEVVYVPSLPGFDDRPLSKPWHTVDYAAWLGQFLSSRKISQCFLIGHSFGGQVAINFTAQYPDQVAGLILINSAGIRNQPNLKRLIFTPLAKLGKWFFSDKLKGVFYRFLHEVDYYQSSPMMKLTLKNILTEDQQVSMAKIIPPTLLIWGESDTYTPLKEGKMIHRLIKNSRLIIIPAGRHGLHYTHVDKLFKLITDFIRHD